MIYKNTLNDCIRSKSLPLLSLFSLPVQVSCRSVASFCGYSSLRSHHAVLGTMGTASWCGDYSLTSIFEKQSKLFKHFLYFFIFLNLFCNCLFTVFCGLLLLCYETKPCKETVHFGLQKCFFILPGSDRLKKIFFLL